MDDRNHYRFVNVWRLKFRPEEVYRALEDIGGYPRWWPDVRRVDRIDDSTVRIVARSVLPYSLTFQATDSRQDEQAGVLEIAMRGDLEGFSRWTIEPERAETLATFEEEVIARKEVTATAGGGGPTVLQVEPRRDDAPRATRAWRLPGRVSSRRRGRIAPESLAPVAESRFPMDLFEVLLA